MPADQLLPTLFLPVGPCGQSAFCLLQLAAVLRKLHLEGAYTLGATIEEGNIMTLAIEALSIVIALFIWGMGVFWLSLASFVCGRAAFRRRLPFSLNWSVPPLIRF